MQSSSHDCSFAPIGRKPKAENNRQRCRRKAQRTLREGPGSWLSGPPGHTITTSAAGSSCSGLFAAVSKGDARPVVDGLAACFEHFFLGDHALGGSRFTLEKTRLWYERLYRLLPDISFDLRAIRISGPPWNTLVAVDWLESNSGTDGVRTFTPGVHVVRLAWGRMTYIGIYPDTVGLVATLQRLSRAGIAEATAEKIEG